MINFKRTNGISFLKNTKFSSNLFVTLMLLYPLLNFLIFYVIGNTTAIMMAFQKTDTETFRSTWAGFYQFEKFFNELFNSTSLVLYIKNSLLFFFILLFLGMPFNLLFAYLLFTRVKGTEVIRWALLIPAMVSGMVTAMLFSKFAEYALPGVLQKYFQIQTHSLIMDERFNLGTLIFYQLITGFSSNVIIYCNSMSAVTDEILESCRMDGANHRHIFWYMCVPMAMPTMTTYIVTGVSGIFACSGGIHLLFYQYTSPENVKTLGFYIFTLSKNDNPRFLDYSYATAINLIFASISFILVSITKKIMDRFDPYREA